MIEFQYTYIMNTDNKTTANVDFVDVERATGEEGEYTTKWDVIENRTFIYSPSISRETLDSLMAEEVNNYV